MIAVIKKLLGLGPKTDFSYLVNSGAVIIDVRSKAEFEAGHIRGAKNIPLNALTGEMKQLKKDQTIITCCASGMRSASGKSILKTNGFLAVYNGGGWQSLELKLLKK